MLDKNIGKLEKNVHNYKYSEDYCNYTIKMLKYMYKEDIIMGYKDQDGNWIEEFRSTLYDTEEEAKKKIEAVYQFHVIENGWLLNGKPRVEKSGNKFVAVIPLKKPNEFDKPRQR